MSGEGSAQQATKNSVGIRDSSERHASLAGEVDLVHLVCLVHLVGLVQQNKRDKRNKPNNGLLMRPLLSWDGPVPEKSIQ